MKTVKLLALCALLASVAVSFTGCACNKCCAAKETAACGMKCCTEGKTDCAHCPTCSAKK